MRIAVTFIVKSPICDHALFDKVVLDKASYAFDLFVTGHFVGKSHLDLTSELCIRTLLDLLHFVPQDFAIEIPSRSIVRKDNLVHYDAAFMGEIVDQTRLFVIEFFTGSVGGGGNSGTATSATHDFY